MPQTLAAMTPTGWEWSWGDNDPLSWAITFGYLIATVLCFAAVVRERRAGPRGRPWFWAVVGAGVLALGLNKQLDLQLWLNEYARRLAHDSSYGRRYRGYDAVLVGVLAVLAVIGVAALARYLGPERRRCQPALVAAGVLCAFVCLRAGVWVPGLEYLNLADYTLIHVAMELAPVAVVAAGAYRAARGRRGETDPAAPGVTGADPGA